MSIRPRGAHGLRIEGISDGALAHLPYDPGWPAVTVSRKGRLRELPPLGIGPERAHISLLHGDRAVMRRDARTATLLTAEAEDDGRLVHPFLTTIAVVFGWWDGRDTFHGGSFVDSSGRAWGLLGERTAGKSSTLAHLSLAGLVVLSDDLLVVEGGKALLGPRCVDLRHDAARALGVASRAVSVRAGERLRLALHEAPPAVELHGWVFLTWGDSADVRRLGPGEWLARVTAHSSTPTGSAPSLLELAGTEAWEITRTRGWDSFEPAVQRLLDIIGN